MTGFVVFCCAHSESLFTALNILLCYSFIQKLYYIHFSPKNEVLHLSCNVLCFCKSSVLTLSSQFMYSPLTVPYMYYFAFVLDNTFVRIVGLMQYFFH